MIKILFLCHGNICRSPMAQFILQDKVKNRKIAGKFEIDSAAISTEEIGNGIYSPAKQILAYHGITGVSHKARLVTKKDYKNFDLIFVMDNEVKEALLKIIGEDSNKKVHMMLPDREVYDPWYSNDFETAYDDIDTGCDIILQSLGF